MEKEGIDRPTADRLLFPKWDAFMHICPVQTTEENTAHLVKAIQRKCAASMALTARAPSLSKLTLRHLEELKIDFSHHAPFRIALETKHPAHLEKGVLFASMKNPKGTLFRQYLENSEVKPGKVVFVDDAKHHVEQMEEELENLGVPFVGFHYTRSTERPFDHELASKEYRSILDQRGIRAAIDIGMGGPKLQVAEVDLATHKIVKMLHTQRYYVDFYQDVSKSGELSPEVMAQGFQSFQEAVSTAKSWGAQEIVAIATASFRAASNGSAFAQEIERETGIAVHIVDQDLEGKLAFQAVLSKLDVPAEDVVVWDIGGGSVQFIRLDPDGIYLVDGLEPGVGAFKDFIVEKIQQRNSKSPNPMSAGDIAQAAQYARRLTKSIPQDLKDKLSCPKTKVIGVGSVFGYGIKGMLGGKNHFSIDDLGAVVHRLPGKTDADLGGGDYAFVEGSNCVFVLGFMQKLAVDNMEIININNADGSLIYKPFW